MKRLSISIIAIVSALLLTSCESVEEVLKMNIRPHQPKFVISLNSVVRYPRGLEIEKDLTTVRGEKITVNRNSFLTSAMIMDAVAIQREDDPHSYDISLKLNQTGLKIWFQLLMDYQDEASVILIDGVYFGPFKPDDGHDEDTVWVTLRGPFNEVIANGIEKFARRNYRELNATASDF